MDFLQKKMKFNIGDFITFKLTGSVYKILDVKKENINLLYIIEGKEILGYKLTNRKELFRLSSEKEIVDVLTERLRQ